jgi:glycosyltransferase involved in cell wall biosynthesis
MNENDKIGILYLVSRLRRQGPIFQLFNIIKYLDREKFNPHIVTLSPEASESYLAAFEEINVECHSLGLSRIGSMMLGPKKIKKLINENPFDLVHVFDYRSTLLCANLSLDIPRVVTARQSYRQVFGPVLGSFMMKTFLRACGKCERTVAVSDSIRNLTENGTIRHIDVIHNGIDREKFKPVDQEEKKRLRARLGLPPDKRIFVNVGFLSENKGLPTLIEAFNRSRESHSDVLVLLGSGPLREKCSSLATGKGDIRPVGFVENVQDYLGAADIFVSASLTEGCPNAVMEAMACGLPVILSDIPAHREILDFDKRAGLLFPTKDIDSLSKAISRSFDGDYSEKSRAALSIINNHLNAKMMSLKYQELYAELCG